MRTRRGSWLALLGALLSMAASPGAPGPGVPLEDRLDLLQVDRRLIAVNAETGGLLEVELELGEEVRALHSRGLVGVATTNVRLLGITTELARWTELRLRVRERDPATPAQLHLGGRIALVPLPGRLVALRSSGGGWTELALGPGEQLLRVLTDANLVAAITSRRAIAIGALGNGFSEIALSPREQIEATSISESSIALTTSRRLLVFRVGTAGWLERARSGAQ